MKTLEQPASHNQEQLYDPEQLIAEVVGYQHQLLAEGEPLQHRFRELVGVDETPLRPAYLHMPTGGHGVSVMLKDETVHECGAYKVRGGAAAVAIVARDMPHKTGVVGASAGNHANGVNYAVRRHNALYGTHLTCDMHVSESASTIKVQPLIADGATVHQEGNRDLGDATAGAKRQAELHPELEFVSAYDDVRVMAGQGTLLHETLLQLQESGVDLLQDEIEIVVPLGGGGMAAGCASWLHELRQTGQVGTGIRLVAVQVADKENCSFVDGTYTKTGEKTDAILMYLKDLGVVSFATVTTTEVANAMQVLAETLSKDVEPAGALATAYVMRDAQERRDAKKKQQEDYSDKKYASVISGANASRETLTEARRLALAGKYFKHCGRLVLRGMFLGHSRIAAAQKIITPRKDR